MRQSVSPSFAFSMSAITYPQLRFLRRLRARSVRGGLNPVALEIKSADAPNPDPDYAVRAEDIDMNDRELNALNWVAMGKSDWEIGEILYLSPKTVNYHVENAKRKLGATTRIQAVVEAVRLGLIAGRAEETT